MDTGAIPDPMGEDQVVAERVLVAGHLDAAPEGMLWQLPDRHGDRAGQRLICAADLPQAGQRQARLPAVGRGLRDFEQRFGGLEVAGIAAVLTRLEFAVGQELAGRQAQGVDPEKQALEFAFLVPVRTDADFQRVVAGRQLLPSELPPADFGKEAQLGEVGCDVVGSDGAPRAIVEPPIQRRAGELVADSAPHGVVARLCDLEGIDDSHAIGRHLLGDFAGVEMHGQPLSVR